FDVNYATCKGCGICAHECPQRAISMVPEDA
ncbi:MAG: 4Fe-4S binding protein, partial [Rhodocyclaceae bacterium]|nr:4Fe-4S binding protein [Rhodocyclaceae bacterium]